MFSDNPEGRLAWGTRLWDAPLLFGGAKRGFDGSVLLGIIRGVGGCSLLGFGGLSAWVSPFFPSVSPVGSGLGLTSVASWFYYRERMGRS